MEKVSKNWTQIMSAIEVGSEVSGIPSDHYGSLCTTRTRLKTKKEFLSAHWSLKVGKGTITIKRTQ